MFFYESLATAAFLLLMLCLPEYIQSTSYNKTVFSDGTIKFNHLAVDVNGTFGGKIFIGAVNRLYELSSDLQLLANVPTGPIPVNSSFLPEHDSYRETQLSADNHNKILLLDHSDNKKLISCWSVVGSHCITYHFTHTNSTISSLIPENFSEPVVANTPDASTVAFISKKSHSRAELELYVAASHTVFSHNQSTVPAVAVRSLKPDKFLQIPANHINNSSTEKAIYFNKTQYRDTYIVNYVYGVSTGTYHYILTIQRNSTELGSPYVSKLIRMCCEGRNVRSLPNVYMEMPLECISNGERPYNLVQTAYVGKPGKELAKSLNVSDPDDDVLFALFSQSQDESGNSKNTNNNRSALCIYSLKAINDRFKKRKKQCFGGIGNRGLGFIKPDEPCLKTNMSETDKYYCDEYSNMPLGEKHPMTASPIIKLNTLATAIVVTQKDTYTNVFVGTSTGHLMKIIVKDANSTWEQAVIPIDEGSPVNSDLLLSPDQNFLYVMTENKLTKINTSLLVSNCERYSTFNNCTQSHTSHCGWCSITKKCTTKGDCHTDNQSSWIQKDSRQYIKINENNFTNIQIGSSKIIQLIVVYEYFDAISQDNTLQCAIDVKNSKDKEPRRRRPFITNASVYSNTKYNYTINCAIPLSFKDFGISQDIHKVAANLSMKANTTIIWSTPILFFDCSSYTSCMECDCSRSSCYWNSARGECSYRGNDYTGDRDTCPDLPAPSISSFSPLKGPSQGGTRITIRGNNLGCRFEQVNDVIEVAGTSCLLIAHYNESQYKSSKEIVCITNASHSGVVGPIKVNVNGLNATSDQNFAFVDPEIEEEPVYDGTDITIKGTNLNSGANVSVHVGTIVCGIYLRNSSHIICFITNPSSSEKLGIITVQFDGNVKNYTYKNDESSSERDQKKYNLQPKGIISGGVAIRIQNRYLVSMFSESEWTFIAHYRDFTYSSSCHFQSEDDVMICPSPLISLDDTGPIEPRKPKEMDYSLKIQNQHSPFTIAGSQKFLLYPDPEFYRFENSSVQFEDEQKYVIIYGDHINKACQKEDIRVQVGNKNCTVKAINKKDQVLCALPKSELPDLYDDPDQEYDELTDIDSITVSIGQHFVRNVSKHPFVPSLNVSTNSFIIYVSSTFCLIATVLLALIAFKYRKTLKTMMTMQKQINKMGLDSIKMRQQMKKIIIQNGISVDQSSSDTLNLFNVTIEYAPIPQGVQIHGPSPPTEYLIPIDHKWEFPRSGLTIGELLGEGEFGRVVKASAWNILRNDTVTEVAVKMLKDIHTDEDMIDLVSEMQIMKLIGTHPNVLRLLGCCTQDGNLLVITEFALWGNLRDFLRRHHPSAMNKITSSNLSKKTLLLYALQVSRGMEHLASFKCVHRDLAARNVLVCEDYSLKIADFGLARSMRNKDYYRKTTNGKLPVKWMAPESLSLGFYTTQSDVWSFGILVWEIMTLGSNPYPSLSDVNKLPEALSSGYRMEKPPNCSEETYALMQECWQYQPEDRPTFAKISKTLDQMISSPEVFEQCDPNKSNGHESIDYLRVVDFDSD
ncbi:plexin-A4-like [Planococcus citri]|uniref:plexin-A4-like n=1 Tax=Planococcus citri TaxID=170843 RepID=UPI0031F90C8B